MSSSEIATGLAWRGLRATVAARGLRAAGAWRAPLLADLALAGFAAAVFADLTGLAVAAGIVSGFEGAVDPLAGAVTSLDFFEFFTIYFCFRTAKPLPTGGRAGKRKPLFTVVIFSMRHFVFRWAITTVAVMVAASLISGIRYDSAASLIGAALLLGILNAFLRPILLLLMAPLIILTLGIFIFVVNGLMLLLVNQFVHGFHVDSFGSAFWGAILISIVSWMLSAFFRGSDGRVHPLTHHTQMRRVKGRVVGSSKPGEL